MTPALTWFSFDLANQISDVIGYYIIPFVSLIGLILNMTCINVLKNLAKKNEFYKFILLKAYSDSIVCLFGIGYLNNNCLTCYQHYCHNYCYMFYIGRIVRINLRTVIFASVITELILNLNRWSILYNKISFLKTIKLKYFLVVLYFSTFTFSLPSQFSIQLECTDNTTSLYTLTTTDFGDSLVFKYFLIILLLFESVLPHFFMIVLSVLNIIKIKQVMAKQMFNSIKISASNQVNQTSNKFKLKELRFTKIVLVLTIFFILVHSFDTLTALFVRLISGWSFQFDPNYYYTALFSRQVSYFCMFLHYSIGLIIYMSMDQKIAAAIKQSFKKLVCLLNLVILKLNYLFFKCKYFVFEGGNRSKKP
jgi:hypothetical protein